jgi:hypothetical protein
MSLALKLKHGEAAAPEVELQETMAYTRAEAVVLVDTYALKLFEP